MSIHKIMKKGFSILLCLCLLLNSCPVVAFAAAEDQLCEHHGAHTPECGYAAGTAEVVCTHVHTESCLATTVNCVHVHGTGECTFVPGKDAVYCGHVCSTGLCGYAAPGEGTACGCVPGEDGTVTHIEGCGYVPADGGTPCGFVHEGCGCAAAVEATGECGHVCSAESGCEKSVYTCGHSEDGSCCYAAAAEGSECTFVCGQCEAEARDLYADPVCNCETDDTTHATYCDLYTAPENPECKCAIPCGSENLNYWCDVCGIQGEEACEADGDEGWAPYADSDTCGDNLTWSLTDGTLTISGTGAMTDYASYIYTPWTDYGNDITTVNIESGVTSIGAYAFAYCSGLTSITISDGVKSIGNSAFEGCTGLTSITIPASVTSIGASAFVGCSRLTSITIPDSVTSIGESAFHSCTSLTSITIPAGVTSIGASAFYGCRGLTSVTIPDSVTSIGKSAFKECSGLTSITIPAGVTSIGTSAFYGCTRLTSITIPGTVTSISNGTFNDCSGLTSVTISEGVKIIEESAFYGCSGLRSVTIPASVTSIGEFAFQDCTSLTTVNVPCSWDVTPLYDFGDSVTVNVAPHTGDVTYSETYTDTEHTAAYAGCKHTVTKAPHTPTCSASGNTITGVCPCGKTITASITVEDKIYDGQGPDCQVDDVYFGSVKPSLGFKQKGEFINETPTQAGDYEAVLTLICNGQTYTASDPFTITPAGLGYQNLPVSIADRATYNGTEQKPVVQETENYTVEYEGDFTNVGEHFIVATGRGNYRGTVKLSFEITALDISVLTAFIEDQTYTGQPLTPKVTFGESYLIEGRDYTVTCSNNVNVTDKPEVIITGIGNCSGSISTTFSIGKASPADPGVVEGEYDDTLANTPLPTADNGVWTWDNPSQVLNATGTHTYSATFTPKDTDNCETVTKDVTVNVARTLEVAVCVGDKVYDGTTDVENATVTFQNLIDADTLLWGTDYSVEARYDDPNAGTGKTVTFTVTLKDTEGARRYRLPDNTFTTTGTIQPLVVFSHVSLVSSAKLVYTGKAHEPAVTVTDGNGNTIPASEYIVTYSDNIEVGPDATVTVTDKDGGNYKVSPGNAYFGISHAPLTITADSKSAYVNAATPELSYTVTGLVNGETLVKAPTLTTNADFTKVGTYAITASGADAGRNYNITYVDGTMTILARPVFEEPAEEKPASGSAAPAPKPVTVPISGEDGTIHVQAQVKAHEVTIKDFDVERLNQVVGDHVEEIGTVTVDFSDLKQNIETVNIPTAAIAHIAEAAADAGNDTEKLEIILDKDISIEFDAMALSHKIEQAKDQNITITVQPENRARDISKVQKEAIGNRTAYEVRITSGDAHIAEIDGEVTVSVAYQLKKGETAGGLKVYAVDEEGNLIPCEAEYDPETGRIRWKTGRHSLYVIACEEPTEEIAEENVPEGYGPGTPNTPARSSNGWLLVLSGTCLTAAAALAAYLYFLWNKPGKYLK